MIAPAAFIDDGRPPKFSQGDHERVLQQAAVIQIADQGRQSLIELRHVGVLHRFENVHMVIPAAVVTGYERDADLDQSPAQQQALAQGVPAIQVAHVFRLARNIERRLRRRRRHQFKSLPIEAVKTQRRVLGLGVVDALHLVERLAQLLAGHRPAFADFGGQHHVAHLEVRAIRIVANDKRRVLTAQKIRPARARHRGQRHVGGHPAAHPALVGNHRAERRMKRDKRAAAHGHGRRRTGHQVVIAAAVIGILVADRADDGELVGRRREVRHDLRKMRAGNLRFDGAKCTANFSRCVGFGIKRLEMGGAAIHPHQDAADLVGTGLAHRLRPLRAQPQQIGKTDARRRAEAQLQEIAASHARTVGLQVAHVFFRVRG